MRTAIGYINKDRSQKDFECQRALIRKCCRNHKLVLLDIRVETDANLAVLTSLSSATCDTIVVCELSNQLSDKDLVPVVRLLYQIALQKDLVMLDHGEITFTDRKQLSFPSFLTQACQFIGHKEQKKAGIEKKTASRQSVYKKYPLACMGAAIPYGFQQVLNPKYDSAKKNTPKFVLAPVPEQIQIVCQIFKWTLQGKSGGAIVSRLNKRGVTGPSNGPISRTQISNVLHNPIYMGEREVEGGRFSTGMPFVSKKDWNRAQQIVHEHMNGSGERTPQEYLLHGLLYCPCGRPMGLARSGGGLCYKCNTKLQAEKDACQYNGILVSTLDRIVWHDVCELYIQEHLPTAMNEKIQKLLDMGQKPDHSDELQSLKNDLEIELTLRKHLHGHINMEHKRRIRQLNRQIFMLGKEAKGYSDLSASLESSLRKERMLQVKKEIKHMTATDRRAWVAHYLTKVEYVSLLFRSGFVIIQHEDGHTSIYAYMFENRRNQVFALGKGVQYVPETKSVHKEFCNGRLTKPLTPHQVVIAPKIQITEITSILKPKKDGGKEI